MPKTKRLGAKKKTTYHLETLVNGEVWSVDTNDIHEGLQQFIFPAVVKTDLVVKVTKGDKTVEQILGVFEARRAMNNSTKLELVAINLVKRFG